nr:hypothetical protein CFP56_65897 [Quercus suber]
MSGWTSAEEGNVDKSDREEDLALIRQLNDVYWTCALVLLLHAVGKRQEAKRGLVAFGMVRHWCNVEHSEA